MLLVGLITMLLAGLVAILIYSLHYGLALALVAGLVVILPIGMLAGVLVGVPLGLHAGLKAFIQHFTLRFWLWRMNDLPWDVIPFLDDAAVRLLLRKVGGSYIFVHWLLRDHLASREVPVSSSGSPSNPSSSQPS